MRTIKFRAWDKTEKTMIPTDQLMHIEFKGEDSWIGYWYVGYDKEGDAEQQQGDGMLKDFVLMQYTGLKDKNDKEIYEGDILRRAKDGDKYTFYIVIEFGSGVFFGVTRPGFNHRLHAERWGNCDSDGGGYDEVIGNIYENPELLKEEYEN